MSEIGDDFKALRQTRKQEREARLSRNEDQYNRDNWRVHTEYHWSRRVRGKILDFWPSRDKWQYDKGEVKIGGLKEWLEARGIEP